MASEIPLPQGKVVLVDDEDYDWLNQWNWRAHRAHDADMFYVIRRTFKHEGRRVVAMHRQILGASPGELVDHRDGNSLNNQRSNLRFCDWFQNNWNRRKGVRNSSGYKGVYWHKTNNSWAAQIVFKGHKLHLGLFPNPIEAARTYDVAAFEHYGDFAVLNFPTKG